MTITGKNEHLDNIIKCAEAYSVSTGILVMLINSNGDVLYSTNEEGCGFCRKSRSMIGESLNCRHAHIYGSYQAERFGGKYVFFCKLGLTHWVSPVPLSESENGALIAGPVLMIRPEDFLFEEILSKSLTTSQIEELKTEIDKIKVVSPDKVDQLSNLLFITAAYISNKGNEYMVDERLKLKQQSDISSYIHHIKTMGGNDEASEHYPIEKEKELLSLISSGDKNGAKKVLNELLGAILLKSGVSFEIIKARVLELIVVLSRAALEGGADAEQIFGLNYKYLNEINKFNTVEDMTVWLSKIMARFSECVFDMKDVKHADIIYKSLDYISKNYMRKISLEEVAAEVYLSPSYFSKVFKEGVGTNFVTYLNKYRISVAKRLLMDNSIDIVDISNLVGYEDQSYFSKSFKKITGTTPGKFRETRGRIKRIEGDGG
ncbi:MAG: helix-turn-helix domain-containing protein [Clostridiaceae bacterium]|nr:helix-turn-helix domain-containing protein [Clostridiaceae bacterium]